MSLTKQFKTNPEKETEGVAVHYGENADGTIPTVFISRMGPSNKAYSRMLEQRTKPYARQIQLGTLDETVARKMFQEIVAGTVVKGWANILLSDITGEVGSDPNAKAEFSRANALALFDRLPDVYDDLKSKAEGASLFRDEDNEEDAKN